MEILVLGNGFDLYHKLPTTYLSFLKTTEYLVKNTLSFPLTIGTVFKNVKEKCNNINTSYNSYAEIYDRLELNQQDVYFLAELCKNNIWWKYFCVCYNEDVGWIDFEKEIALVIDEFNSFFEKIGNNKVIQGFNNCLISLFDFFTTQDTSFGVSTIKIKENFLVERFKSSGEYIPNKQKIVDELYSSLVDFSKILGLYLQLFIENPLEEMMSENLIAKNEFVFKNAEYILSFNYTHVYEKLYGEKEVYHIHGKTNNCMVIGINADENDNKNGNQLFIDFKKYFQRLCFGITEPYEEFFAKLKRIYKVSNDSIAKDIISLKIIGHSIDITDKDIIEELFEYSHEISIFYHSLDSRKSYIKNLLKIFGKDEFMQLSRKRQLKFIML